MARHVALSLVLALGASLSLAACDLEVGDLNNPGLDELEDNPTRANITAAATGLLIGNRAGIAAANGYTVQLGVLAREGYNFDTADPRFIGELIAGQLQPGSPFGGAFWGLPYGNIRAANLVLGGVDRVPEFSAEEREAIKGFTKTIMALDTLIVINTHDTNGAVIDTNRPINEIGDIRCKDAVFTYIKMLLDEAKVHLMAGGDAFPQALSAGYTGFNTPATFLTFNRALKARVEAYTENWAAVLTALDESFIVFDPDNLQLDLGVYHSYSTGSGDAVNAMNNPNIYAHPSLVTDAEMQVDGTTPDARVGRKIKMAEMTGSSQGLESDFQFTLYDNPSKPVAIIRNEELLLLRAEAKIRLGGDNLSGGIDDLNLVRVASGNLAPLAGITTEAAAIDALLHERRYSLMFEGHLWLDLRRYDRLDESIVDREGDSVNLLYPIPQDEQNARPAPIVCVP